MGSIEAKSIRVHRGNVGLWAKNETRFNQSYPFRDEFPYTLLKTNEFFSRTTLFKNGLVR